MMMMMMISNTSHLPLVPCLILLCCILQQNTVYAGKNSGNIVAAAINNMNNNNNNNGRYTTSDQYTATSTKTTNPVLTDDVDDDDDNDNDSVVDNDTDTDRIPTLFGPEEAQYDRYAACLAATEMLRKVRDRKLDSKKNNNNRFQKSKNKQHTGKTSEEQKRIDAEYVHNSGKILQAMGMSVSQYNQLTRQISEDNTMKERIMEQAYLYKLASTLDMDRIPLVEDPASEELLQATRRQRLQLFCDSIQEIEQLRGDQLKKLKRSLHVAKLPRNVRLSDPSMMPFLSPKIRAVVEAFPLQAEEIVKKHGLNSDEFNDMLHKVKTNTIFRYKVEKRVKQTKKQKQPNNKNKGKK